MVLRSFRGGPCGKGCSPRRPAGNFRSAMPAASALLVKAAWIWLSAGMGIGLVMAVAKAVGKPVLLTALWPVHVHVLLAGFVLQWIMGIAFWFYPRTAGQGLAPHHRRVIAAWILLNLGIVVRSVSEPAMSLLPGTPFWPVLFVASASLQFLAGVLFVSAIWGRIWCSLRLPEGRRRETNLLAAALAVLRGKEEP